MNIKKMLLMYLEEHGIRAYIKENRYLRGHMGGSDDDNAITIFLKHTDIDDTIELSIMSTEIQIKGTKVYGRLQKRSTGPNKYTNGGFAFDEIADLVDPQAFERIRLWIRKQEKTMRYSASVAQAAMRLQASSYALSKPEMLDDDLENFKKIHGDDKFDLKSVVGNIKIQPPYELPESEDTSKSIT